MLLPILGMTNRLKRSAARARPAPAFQSSQRRVSARRPIPAWTAFRRHSERVMAIELMGRGRPLTLLPSGGRGSGLSGLRPGTARDVLDERVAVVADRASRDSLVPRDVQD